ncbi:hypothetical protein GCM10025768_15950 [Microbacterium pseudoresistens]|uniref:Barstar (barnase inhibitor) domain-containing protein n=1 Tax=Microbacterium pseudoresistens TaxID=640634 RepID=A0A7Y9ESC4_9MICO|nr:barstar family protein [Microbacterium pseudoresistens]NYD53054.1 hypothetical protein [Microbacterium pseudoresistens]
MTIERFRIDGAAIGTIDDLYDQLNALLMADEDWRMGANLDALDDVLYRFDHDLARAPHAEFVWDGHAHSERALGLETTRRWLEAKLDRPGMFNESGIRRQLEQLLDGEGKTYFEIVCQVFGDHPGVRLDLR